MRLANEVQRGRPVTRREDVVPFARKVSLDELDEIRFVVDDEYADGASRLDNATTSTTAPLDSIGPTRVPSLVFGVRNPKPLTRNS